MLSRLEPIIGKWIRQAEQVDARQEIVREDPLFEKRNQQNDGRSSSADEIDDIASVSLAGLVSFLEAELKSYRDEAAKADNAAPTAAADQSQTPASPAMNMRAAQAAQAYRQLDTTQSPPASAAQAGSSEALLGAVDLRRLMRLVEDLKDLLARGYTEIPIQRDMSFLDSLELGIRNARA